MDKLGFFSFENEAGCLLKASGKQEMKQKPIEAVLQAPLSDEDALYKGLLEGLKSDLAIARNATIRATIKRENMEAENVKRIFARNAYRRDVMEAEFHCVKDHNSLVGKFQGDLEVVSSLKYMESNMQESLIGMLEPFKQIRSQISGFGHSLRSKAVQVDTKEMSDAVLFEAFIKDLYGDRKELARRIFCHKISKAPMFTKPFVVKQASVRIVEQECVQIDEPEIMIFSEGKKANNVLTTISID